MIFESTAHRMAKFERKTTTTFKKNNKQTNKQKNQKKREKQSDTKNLTNKTQNVNCFKTYIITNKMDFNSKRLLHLF